MNFRLYDLKNFINFGKGLWLHLHGEFDFQPWRHEQSEPHNFYDENEESVNIIAVCVMR